MAMCFILLIVCVIGIAKDGPVGLVCFYEKDVQDRVVELGLTTTDKIKRNSIVAAIAVTLPITILIPYMVYVINGAIGFKDAFFQMLVISLIANVFDRLFIDSCGGLHVSLRATNCKEIIWLVACTTGVYSDALAVQKVT